MTAPSTVSSASFTSLTAPFTAAIDAQLRRLGDADAGAAAEHEAALERVHAALAEAQTRYEAATRTALASWEGTGAGEAHSRARALATAMGTASTNAGATLGALRDAVASVAAGRAEIQAMIDDFARWAQGQIAVLRAGPEPVRAAVGAGIWAEANAAAARAAEVVARVGQELSGLAARLRGRGESRLGDVGAPLTQPMAAPTLPAAVTAPPLSGGGAGVLGNALAGLGTLGTGPGGAPPGAAPGGYGFGGAPSGYSGGHGGFGASGHGSHGGTGHGGYAVGPNLPAVAPIPPGAGVGLGLPDGGTAEAPNEIAANAVRYALSQLGVPYVWGAACPGAGFDCSGLTSWAYGMAGLELPRHSAEQAVGASVPPGLLMPGDLLVWSGHVAMVIGDGMIVEAGDPVQVNAVRTANIGMQFLGFYRPTGWTA